MPRKNTRNTKGRIISAAWKLFYEQGYEETTVEDIVFESETSKGSFYHYFDGKDALVGTLAYVFDEKYEQLMQDMDPEMGAVEKLIYLDHVGAAAVYPAACPGRKASVGSQPHIFQAAPADHHRWTAQR